MICVRGQLLLNSLNDPEGLLQVYEIPFFVALDHKREAVLVAVRGTLSLKVSREVCDLCLCLTLGDTVSKHVGMLCNM